MSNDRTRVLRIGLIGDQDPRVIAHRAIPHALARSAEAAGLRVESHWLDTASLHAGSDLFGYDGLWCVPGSPYRSMDGALVGIRHAREQGIPFLGSCGGFQHALIEYARTVLHWAAAEHAETAPGADLAVIAPLACALVEVIGEVMLLQGSRIANAYRKASIREVYHCRYGLNPDLQERLLGGALQAVGHDAEGAVRAVELDGHPFFVATLFQHERHALDGRPTPLVGAFLAACGQTG
jgi:CTP synthase (UTP-ammonia lyase)